MLMIIFVANAYERNGVANFFRDQARDIAEISPRCDREAREMHSRCSRDAFEMRAADEETSS